jgi:hypothetical protein
MQKFYHKSFSNREKKEQFLHKKDLETAAEHQYAMKAGAFSQRGCFHQLKCSTECEF